MKEAINATIQRILRTDRGITANQVLVDDLGFDSLKLFQLITELEDEFDIAISFRDAQNIKTVGDVYTSVAVWFPETAKPAPLGKGTASPTTPILIWSEELSPRLPAATSPS